MDERESIYLDTISLASDYPNRKSLSLSRQTIYHSAEELTNFSSMEQNEQKPKSFLSSCSSSTTSPSTKYSNQLINAEKSTHLLADTTDGKNKDEVSDRLLYNNNNKKLTVTYSQWKSRVTFIYYFMLKLCCNIIFCVIKKFKKKWLQWV